MIIPSGGLMRWTGASLCLTPDFLPGMAKYVWGKVRLPGIAEMLRGGRRSGRCHGNASA